MLAFGRPCYTSVYLFGGSFLSMVLFFLVLYHESALGFSRSKNCLGLIICLHCLLRVIFFREKEWIGFVTLALVCASVFLFLRVHDVS